VTYINQFRKYLYKVVTLIVNGNSQEVVITSVNADWIRAVGLDVNNNLVVKTFQLDNKNSIIIKEITC
jgi:hypothetical protein